MVSSEVVCVFGYFDVIINYPYTQNIHYLVGEELLCLYQRDYMD